MFLPWSPGNRSSRPIVSRRSTIQIVCDLEDGLSTGEITQSEVKTVSTSGTYLLGCSCVCVPCKRLVPGKSLIILDKRYQPVQTCCQITCTSGMFCHEMLEEE